MNVKSDAKPHLKGFVIFLRVISSRQAVSVRYFAEEHCDRTSRKLALLPLELMKTDKNSRSIPLFSYFQTFLLLSRKSHSES